MAELTVRELFDAEDMADALAGKLASAVAGYVNATLSECSLVLDAGEDGDVIVMLEDVRIEPMYEASLWPQLERLIKSEAQDGSGDFLRALAVRLRAAADLAEAKAT